jgi:hypothetical protein
MKKLNRYKFKLVSLCCALLLLCMSATYVWNETTQIEYDKVTKRSGDFYDSKKHYAVRITHTSYRGHDVVTPYETREGYYRFDNGSYHSLLLGVHTIQNKKYRIVIDTVAKTMLVGDPVAKRADEISEINYANSMKDVKRFLSCAVAAGVRYRLEYNEKPMYEAYETKFNTSGMMTEMTVFYRKQYAINPNDANSPKAKPKLKITWSDLNEKVVFATDEFSSEKYFTEVNKKLTPTSKYKGYRITDVRVKK